MADLKVGAKAPNFLLADQTGSARDLEYFLNRYTVIYFYPKDDTPGCTLESRELSVSYPELKKLGASVIGVSGGTAASKKKFCDKYGLTIPLLADEDFGIAKKYQAYGEKKFMGRSYLGILRKTFVLDSSGNVLKVYSDVKPQGHADALLAFIKGLGANAPKTAAEAKPQSKIKKKQAPLKAAGRSTASAASKLTTATKVKKRRP